MATRISVRLDKETRQLLEDLKLRLGWSYSKILREAILLLAAQEGLLEPERMSSESSCNTSDLVTSNVGLKGRSAKQTDHRPRHRK
jgi:hypothetical protein